MAMFVVFIGAGGVLLDVSAVQIVAAQSGFVVSYLIGALIREGISLRRDMQRQREA